MSTIPNCPQCDSDLAYEDRGLFVCPMCSFEWTQLSVEEAQIKEIGRASCRERV